MITIMCTLLQFELRIIIPSVNTNTDSEKLFNLYCLFLIILFFLIPIPSILYPHKSWTLKQTYLLIHLKHKAAEAHWSIPEVKFHLQYGITAVQHRLVKMRLKNIVLIVSCQYIVSTSVATWKNIFRKYTKSMLKFLWVEFNQKQFSS